MATIARRLAPEDLAAVADWLASQPVPARSGPAAATGGRLALDCGGIDGLPAPLGGGAR
jgi:cytochrome c553